MTKVVGVDWASKGWFGVVLRESGEWGADLFPSILSLWKAHSDADRILIDIPIGLPSDSRRECDVEAKAVLGSRQRSVFYTPTRTAVYEQNLGAAKDINEAEAGFSIQNQAWGIVPRIREVDEFLDVYPGARDRLMETHPEVCFYALNGAPMTATKQTEKGIRQRLELLADERGDAEAIFDEAVATFTMPSYAPMVSDEDDIVDALVAAVVASRDPGRTASLPEGDVPRDARGLPMQILYPVDEEQRRLPL